jgi:hypothetical protein
MLSLLSFSQKTGISEGCIKDVKLASTERNNLLLPAGLWHQKFENISSGRNRSDYIMQTYTIKKHEKFLQSASNLQEKIKNRV